MFGPRGALMRRVGRGRVQDPDHQLVGECACGGGGANHGGLGEDDGGGDGGSVVAVEHLGALGVR
eukprot:6222342-Prymnesium_polylepis.1